MIQNKAPQLTNAEIHEGLTYDEYEALPGWSRSQIADQLTSPRGARWRREGMKRCVVEDTGAMRLGRLWDIVLHSGLDAARDHIFGGVSEWPKELERTPKGMIAKNKKAMLNLQLYAEEHGMTLEEMEDRFRTKKELEELQESYDEIAWLHKCWSESIHCQAIEHFIEHKQIVITWNRVVEIASEQRCVEVPCKAMLDAVAPGRYVVDDKTTTSTWPKFPVTAARFAYDIQDVHYREAWKAHSGEDLPMLFRCQMPKWPFDSYIVRLDGDLINSATLLRNRALFQIAAGLFDEDPLETTHTPHTPPYIFADRMMRFDEPIDLSGVNDG